ncbi:MAG: hypothetical protein PS018_17550 [bacterium]|nr:hypothetical protein [bacterium]
MGRTHTTIRRHWPAWLNAMLLLAVSSVGIAGLTFQARPETEIVAVAFPVWWDAPQAFTAAASANASIVRLTAVPSLLVVRPDGREGLSRLQQAGAWFTLDPQTIAACFTKAI